MLIIHLLFALSSIIVTGMALILPSLKKLHASYGLIAGTLASGTVLVISTHSQLLQSCTTGLAYVAVVGGAAAAANYRLARVKIDQE